MVLPVFVVAFFLFLLILNTTSLFQIYFMDTNCFQTIVLWPAYNSSCFTEAVLELCLSSQPAKNLWLVQLSSILWILIMWPLFIFTVVR